MIEPVDGAGDEFVHGGVAAIGGDDRLETPPQIFAGIEFGRTKRQPGDLDPGSVCGIPDHVGVMRWRVVPDQELRYSRTHSTERGDDPRNIRSPRPIRHDPHDLAGPGVTHTVQRPPRIASADGDDRLLTTPRPGRPQRRELAQRRGVTDPDLTTGRYDVSDTCADVLFFWA